MPALRHDMPAQELRLHLGEMTAQEERTARAAIRWANIERDREVDSLRREVDELRAIWRDALPWVLHIRKLNANSDFCEDAVAEVDDILARAKAALRLADEGGDSE